MSAVDEYEGIWDMFVQMHRQTHGENHAPTRDFNCCGEFAVLMALRAASTLKSDYPHHLLLRMSAMEELDRDFYVKNLLSTDGEPEPSDPEPLREYREPALSHPVDGTQRGRRADRVPGTGARAVRGSNCGTGRNLAENRRSCLVAREGL